MTRWRANRSQPVSSARFGTSGASSVWRLGWRARWSEARREGRSDRGDGVGRHDDLARPGRAQDPGRRVVCLRFARSRRGGGVPREDGPGHGGDARPGVVFFASSDDASAELAEAFAAEGIFVIDNSATFRMDPRCPLIIPEVNPHTLVTGQRICPVANCTSIVLCVALAPVVPVAGLRAVRVATYQAVSGAGRAGVETLEAEERAAFEGREGTLSGTFAAPILRNVVPQIGSFDERGDSGEEKKVVAETRKMLGLPNLHVAATTVRVPVYYAHSEAVFFETERDTSVAELARAFSEAEGVVFHPTGIVTPRDVEGTDLVHVARLRPESDS